MSLLSVTGLRAGYGRIEVLHGIDLEVADGGIIILRFSSTFRHIAHIELIYYMI